MIDTLFGSKTRVKLLHLFLNNPGKSFYVREITRIIDEQINSVRRELSNMLNVGVIESDSADNKLYYQVNQRYEYYKPLRAIFGNAKDFEIVDKGTEAFGKVSDNKYKYIFETIDDLRLAIMAGSLVQGSTSKVDILFVGNLSANKVQSAISHIEKNEGREISYSILPYDEFYYRLSVRDKFITEIINNIHEVIIDKDNILTKDQGAES